MTTVAYLGFLVGPVAVGLASSLTSLSTALTGVAAVTVLLAARPQPLRGARRKEPSVVSQFRLRRVADSGDAAEGLAAR